MAWCLFADSLRNPQPWYKARSEVDARLVVEWNGHSEQTAVFAFTAQTLWRKHLEQQKETSMHKSLVFLVVAFNISIQTKALYENSLNYYHLKLV